MWLSQSCSELVVRSGFKSERKEENVGSSVYLIPGKAGK